MYFKQILNELCGCASYVIASRETHEAAIVDPSLHLDEYDALIKERKFTLRYVIDTHVHADHVSGARALVARHEGAELCLHEAAPVVYPFRALTDGEQLEVGELRLKVVHTPGHRPEVVSLLVVNPPRSPEASMVLTGDSLLAGDVGRPDFGGGSSAEAQYESITRLLRLPDWVAVFPGHFEGPCGKGMCGRPSTTIGFERLFNPMARLERAEFVSAVMEGTPARPLNMAAIYATNRGVEDAPWAMLTSSPEVAEVALAAVEGRADDAVLVDVREHDEYAHGHVPGAINIPQADLALRLAELPRDRPVLAICQWGSRSLRAAQFLKQMGYQDVVSVADGTGGWEEQGKPLAYGDTTIERRSIAESEWTHAGALGAAAAG